MRHMSLVLLLALTENILMQKDCSPGEIRKRGKCEDENECESYPSICGRKAKCFNTVGSYYCQCLEGFTTYSTHNFTQADAIECQDIDECKDGSADCGPHTVCVNSEGGYYCTCDTGYISSNGKDIFNAGQGVQCNDINECKDGSIDCGPHTVCVNSEGGYYCTCDTGYISSNGKDLFPAGQGVQCNDIDECKDGSIDCGPHTVCVNSEGGYYCTCDTGYISSNGKDLFPAGQGVQCNENKCNRLLRESGTSPTPELTKLISSMSNSCLALSQSDSVRNNAQVNGEKLLKAFLSDLDNLPQGGFSGDTYIISAMFRIVIMILKWIGHLLSESQTRKTSTKADVELLVKRDSSPPEGNFMMNVSGAQLTSNWNTATGNKHPGFPSAALISYKGLEKSLNCCFNQLKTQQNQTFKINSKVVTATFSNYETADLKKPIKLTFYHLEKKSEKHTCVFWDPELEGGAWSTDGCTTERSSVHQTVCSCYKLGSFAVLTTLCDTGLCRPTLNFCQQGSKP